MNTFAMKNRSFSRRRGLTLLDMIISIPLVGIALVAALNTVGASKASQFKVDNMRQGHLLAQDLMSEILQQDYTDGDMAQATRKTLMSMGSVTYPLGPDNVPGRNEVATGNRSLFNDVDDYDGWVASPPQAKDGTTYTSMTGWSRSVSVVFVNANDLSTAITVDNGNKRITVTVAYNNIPAAKIVAIKTIGLPLLEACCFDGGFCENLRAEACATQGGTSQGTDTYCANTTCPTGPTVLYVVADTANLTAQELARQTLMASWGFGIQLIRASASQSNYAKALIGVDVAYISVEVAAIDLGTKLTNATVGVVNANVPLISSLGFASGSTFYVNLSAVNVVDNTHFITSTFATGTLTLSTSTQWFSEVVSGIAGGAQVLATIDSGKDSLFVIESGDLLVGGTPAAGRRVQLPWGDVSFDFNALSADGQTLMKRAIEWAAQKPAICGDGNCDTGEDTCTCPADCGAQAAFEQPGVNCNDGLDNDCNGSTDCADPNCSTDAACLICGNGLCELGEDCTTCVTDCLSKSNGPKSGRYCCGNGIAESAEGDGSICDGNY